MRPVARPGVGVHLIQRLRAKLLDTDHRERLWRVGYRQRRNQYDPVACRNRVALGG